MELTRHFLTLSRELGDRFNEAIAMANMGIVLQRFGDLDESQPALEGALALLGAIGERHVQGGVHCALACVAVCRGEPERGRDSARLALAIAEESRSPDRRMTALAIVGLTEMGVGQMEAAREAFEECRACALACGVPVFDALGNLAALALAQGDVPAARASLQPVFDHMAAGGNLDGCIEPHAIDWVCHDTLAREGDPQAFEWLARAHAALMAQAGSITDARLRQCYLDNMPNHRRILAAWAAWSRDAPADGTSNSHS